MLYTASFYAPDNWEGMRYRVSRSHPRGRLTQWDTLPFLYPARDLLVAYRTGELHIPTLTRVANLVHVASVGRQHTVVSVQRRVQGCAVSHASAIPGPRPRTARSRATRSWRTTSLVPTTLPICAREQPEQDRCEQSDRCRAGHRGMV